MNDPTLPDMLPPSPAKLIVHGTREIIINDPEIYEDAHRFEIILRLPEGVHYSTASLLPRGDYYVLTINGYVVKWGKLLKFIDGKTVQKRVVQASNIVIFTGALFDYAPTLELM